MGEKSRQFIDDIISKIPRVKSGVVENNEKLEAVPTNIATIPKPENKDILSSKVSRFDKDT